MAGGCYAGLRLHTEDTSPRWLLKIAKTANHRRNHKKMMKNHRTTFGSVIHTSNLSCLILNK